VDDAQGSPLFDVRDLAVEFPVRTGAFAWNMRALGRNTRRFERMTRAFARREGSIIAVDRVSFRIERGETLAVVGESGSGKSTLGRALLRLVEPTRGRALYRPDPAREPRDLFALSARSMHAVRKELSIVFQDPFSSLNPRLSVGDTLSEPLRVHRLARGADIDREVEHLLARVGLPLAVRERHPHALSGGERQRVAIARALALGPRFVVCDEAVSALDASLRADILQLLADLQRELAISYLFIAHDLAIVRGFADRVIVMYAGRIVERGTVDQIFESPAHPYTRALLAAMPRIDRAASTSIAPSSSLVTGEPPSVLNRPSGCSFHPRCPLAEARCRAVDPVEVALGGGHAAACHLLDPAPTDAFNDRE
jgi:oligopeptide/dipeptide ABC transporter ATP-binding protein